MAKMAQIHQIFTKIVQWVDNNIEGLFFSFFSHFCI
jgi:hypothetical protein